MLYYELDDKTYAGESLKDNETILTAIMRSHSDKYYHTFLEHIFKHIFCPLLGLSWKTEIYRTKELRPGCFSIRPCDKWYAMKVEQMAKRGFINFSQITLFSLRQDNTGFGY